MVDEEEVAKSRKACELRKSGKVADVSIGLKKMKISVGGYCFLQTALLNRNL